MPSRLLMPPPIRGARAALVFLSRIPAGGFPYRDADWQWAPAHFPFVGALVGGCSAGVLWASAGLGPTISACLAVVSSILLTGAFHEDGLADSADGLGGAHGGKRILEIMKDSRIGTYGAAALILSILLRVAAMASVPSSAIAGLVVVHTAARVSPVWLLAGLPYVCLPESKSTLVARARPIHAIVATGWGCLVCFGIAHYLGWPVVAIPVLALALAVISWLAARRFQRAVGGITGDFLGATEQLGEVAGWLVLIAILGNP